MPLKLFGKSAAIGLDLGHRAIRATQIERNGNGWRIVRFASVETPAGSIKDGVVIDVEAVSQAIRQALREGHFNSSSAHIAVSGGTVVVRVVKVPSMAEATLRKSIKYEAGRYVPSSSEESYIEFEIVGKTEDGQMEVLLVAAPKEIVQARMAACQGAGLEIESVDVEPFAAYRSLVEADPELDLHAQTFALIDVGAANTRMSVIQNGVFTMTRSIPHGAQMLTEALKGYFKLSDEDAEAGKAQLDIAELIEEAKPRENPPLRVIQPHVDDLVREIRRSLNYFQSQLSEGHQNKSVETLLLTGGGAKLKQGGDPLSGSGDLEVHVAAKVLHALDVGKDLEDLAVGHETHCDPGDGGLDLDPRVHEREGRAADRSHRGRTVRLQHFAEEQQSVREVGIVQRDHRPQSSFRQCAVADFSPAGSAERPHFAHRIRREVVEVHVASRLLFFDAVHGLRFVRKSEGGDGHDLGLAPSKESGAVDSGKDPRNRLQGPNLIELSPVGSFAVLEDELADGAFDDLFDRFGKLRRLFWRIGINLLVLLDDTFLEIAEGRFACGLVLLDQGLGDRLAHLLFDLFVNVFIDFHEVYGPFVLARLLGELLDLAADLFDRVVGELERLDHVGLAHFGRARFDHRDRAFVSRHHEVQIGLVDFRDGREEDELAVDASDANTGNRSIEG